LYTRRTLTSIVKGFPNWLKSQPFIVIGWEPWSKKRVNYLSCIEGKGVVTTCSVVYKMPRSVLIYYKLYFVTIMSYVICLITHEFICLLFTCCFDLYVYIYVSLLFILLVLLRFPWTTYLFVVNSLNDNIHRKSHR
jgi:hypothetical protein